MANIRKDDLVQVIAGRDKGLQGRVLSVDSDNDRVIVEGVMRVKKHVKVGQTSRGATTGGIETVEAAIHVSNVMVVDSEGNPTRIGYRVDEESGKKVRVSKRNGKDI